MTLTNQSEAQMARGSFLQQTKVVNSEAREVLVGGEGPGVLVMHEVPGLHPEVIRFGEDLIDAGFRVWMPSLFGPINRAPNIADTGKTLLRACIRREFTVWRTNRTSPITRWLRGLAKQLSQETGGGIGAVGMCLTGGFAMALMVDPWVVAPVCSQPSLPFGFFPWQRRDLGLSPGDLVCLKNRVEQGAKVLGLRYRADVMVPGSRFVRLRGELGDSFQAIELGGSAFWKHSVLATDRDETSVQKVIAFLREHVQEGDSC